MYIEYSWNEISNYTSMCENKLILMYCLYANKYSKNKRLSMSLRNLSKKINIPKIPSTLVRDNLIIVTKNGVFSNYECKVPESYCTNLSFLHDKVNYIYKCEYLSLLAIRRIGDNSTEIPKIFGEKYHIKNPYIGISTTTLKFKPEQGKQQL